MLDDLHFAPASEASSVAALAHAATQGRVLVVLTSRPGAAVVAITDSARMAADSQRFIAFRIATLIFTTSR